MAGTETERVIQLFVNDLSVYGDFLADFSDGPDDFEIEAADPTGFTATPADGGAALARYVTVLQDEHPTWAGVDVESVDWPAVSRSVERRLLQQVGLGRIL